MSPCPQMPVCVPMPTHSDTHTHGCPCRCPLPSRTGLHAKGWTQCPGAQWWLGHHGVLGTGTAGRGGSAGGPARLSSGHGGPRLRDSFAGPTATAVTDCGMGWMDGGVGWVQLQVQPSCLAPASDPQSRQTSPPSAPPWGQEGPIPPSGRSRGCGELSHGLGKPHPASPASPNPAGPGAAAEDPVWGQWVTWLGGLGVLQTAPPCSPHPRLTSTPTPRSEDHAGVLCSQWDPSETCWQPGDFA